MRAEEFELTICNLDGFRQARGMSMSDCLGIYEQVIGHTSGLVMESIESQPKYQLLSTLDNSSQLVVGETYLPIFFMLAQQRLFLYDCELMSSKNAGMVPMTLVSRQGIEMIFDHDGVQVKWPDSQLRFSLYTSVIGVDTAEEYQSLNTLFALHFEQTLPELKEII